MAYNAIGGFPPQQLSFSRKNKAWRKKCVDRYLCNTFFEDNPYSKETGGRIFDDGGYTQYNGAAKPAKPFVRNDVPFSYGPADSFYYDDDGLMVTKDGRRASHLLDDVVITPGEKVSKELPLMDTFRTMPTNEEASHYADWRDSTVVPHIGDFVSAWLKPLDATMPSRWVGLLDSDNNNGLLHLFDEDNRGFFINDNPYGLFSKRYAEEHPYWAMAGNMMGDVLIGLGSKKALDSTKNLYHSVIREPIPFSEKQAAVQRMEDFIHSADYIQKQKYAGLTDTDISDFQDMVSRRLNGGDFPAYYRRMRGKGMSLVLPNPVGGVYMKRGLSPEDFLNAFDHEVAHYSTVNFGKSGKLFNRLAGWVNKENPTIVEKMMDYNSGVVPLRPKSDALIIRKDRGLNSDASWLNRPKSQKRLNYFQDEQEIRSNAYAIIQDAERRGMSIDDYVDFCTSPNGEIYRASPTPIKYLNYAFTPDDMKKFLKGFLSISAPTTLITNITDKNDK